MLYSEKVYLQFDDILIVLGCSCNNICKHCGQGNKELSYVVNSQIDEKLLVFLKELCFVRSKLKKESFICLVGGETLLYFEKIKNIIKYLYSCKEIDFNYINFSVTSNGILLTEEMVDFFNEYKIGFTLSYDGPNRTALRKFYMSDSKICLFNKIKNRKVKFALCSDNPSFLESLNYIREKFGDIKAIPYYLNVLGNCDESLLVSNEQVYQNSLDLCNLIRNDVKYGYLTKDIMKIPRKKFYENSFIKNIRCNLSSSLGLNSLGYILVCEFAKESCEKIGEILEEDLINFRKFVDIDEKSDCKVCPIYFYCRGGCPRDDLHLGCKQRQAEILGYIDGGLLSADNLCRY